MTKPEPASENENLIAEVVAIRADLISLLMRSERLLAVNGVRVESAIVTRQERRVLTRKPRKHRM
jgi:hypothetical protein